MFRARHGENVPHTTGGLALNDTIAVALTMILEVFGKAHPNKRVSFTNHETPCKHCPLTHKQ